MGLSYTLISAALVSSGLFVNSNFDLIYYHELMSQVSGHPNSLQPLLSSPGELPGSNSMESFSFPIH